MSGWVHASAIAVLIAACLSQAACSSTPAALPVSIKASTYGEVDVVTKAGALCTASVRLPSDPPNRTGHSLGDAVVADGSGFATWQYPASRSIPPGTGAHVVSCRLGQQTGSARAPFKVESDD
jgi:hypothetical protein